MHVLDWILRPFCRHEKEIFRRRGERMGMECLTCFRWRPLDEPGPVPYSQTSNTQSNRNANSVR